MGRNSPDRTDILQGAASVAGVLGGLSAVVFVVGAALIALRLKALGFSTSILAASEIPRGYAFGIGLRTVLSNVPFGVIAYLLITAMTFFFRQRRVAASTFTRVWSVGLTTLGLGLLVVLLAIARTWILLVVAVATASAIWVVVRGARSSFGRPRRRTSVWLRVILSVAITAAIAVADEADRITFVVFDQAVVVFRHGFSRRDVLGVQKPLLAQATDIRTTPRKPAYGPEVLPVYTGTDRLCMDERRPHICGLLLGIGGDGVTVASLAFPNPRIVNVPHDEVATAFVVPAETQIGTDEETYRRLPLHCRLPLLKQLSELGGCNGRS